MIEVYHAGIVDYQTAWQWQKRRVREVKAGLAPEALFLLEHPHVITVGRGGGTNHILISDSERVRLGIQLVEIDRGGDVTYHGPGQLVGYPILRLARRNNDPHRYLRDLEEVLIRTLADFNIVAGRKEKYTGVWVGDEKIAAIGVKMNRSKKAGGFITSHGFALNAGTDLQMFSHIIPCGIQEYGVTSLSQLGVRCSVEQLIPHLCLHFEEVFEETLNHPNLNPYHPNRDGG